MATSNNQMVYSLHKSCRVHSSPSTTDHTPLSAPAETAPVRLLETPKVTVQRTKVRNPQVDALSCHLTSTESTASLSEFVRWHSDA